MIRFHNRDHRPGFVIRYICGAEDAALYLFVYYNVRFTLVICDVDTSCLILLHYKFVVIICVDSVKYTNFGARMISD